MTQEWRPHRKQEQFISLPFSIFEAFYGGAAGGGKSELLILLPLIYGFHKHPKFKGIILRRTFPELEAEIIVRAKPYYEAAEGSYNSQKKRWTFKSGAIMQFGHAEYEKDITKYDTAEYQYVGFDELTHFTQYQYLYMSMSRCRSSAVGLPAIVRSASNPGNIGHTWVRKRFVEPTPNGGKIIADALTGIKRFYIQAKATDNPYLIANDPQYIKRLEMLPEAERRAKLDGDWWTFSGQVFTDWRVAPFGDEPPNAQHVIRPFEIPEWWPRIIAVDWGTTAMTIALWAAVSPEGRIYVYRERAWNGGESRKHLSQNVKVSTWASEIGQLSLGERIVDIVLDSNAFNVQAEDNTVAELFRRYSGLNPRRADKGQGSRVNGRALIEEFLRWQVRPESVVSRADFDPDYAQYLLSKGLTEYNNYLSRFREQEVVEHIPRLQVFDTCKELVNCVPACVWDDTNKEDVAEFDGDDPYDCLRYLLSAVDFYVRGVQNKASLLAKQREAEKLLSIDPTAYYMKMRQFEANEQRFGVSRASRRLH